MIVGRVSGPVVVGAVVVVVGRVVVGGLVVLEVVVVVAVVGGLVVGTAVVGASVVGAAVVGAVVGAVVVGAAEVGAAVVGAAVGTGVITGAGDNGGPAVVGEDSDGRRVVAERFTTRVVGTVETTVVDEPREPPVDSEGASEGPAGSGIVVSGLAESGTEGSRSSTIGRVEMPRMAAVGTSSGSAGRNALEEGEGQTSGHPDADGQGQFPAGGRPAGRRTTGGETPIVGQLAAQVEEELLDALLTACGIGIDRCIERLARFDDDGPGHHSERVHVGGHVDLAPSDLGRHRDVGPEMRAQREVGEDQPAVGATSNGLGPEGAVDESGRVQHADGGRHLTDIGQRHDGEGLGAEVLEHHPGHTGGSGPRVDSRVDPAVEHRGGHREIEGAQRLVGGDEGVERHGVGAADGDHVDHDLVDRASAAPTAHPARRRCEHLEFDSGNAGLRSLHQGPPPGTHQR